MAKTYQRKKKKQRNVLYTVITAILICTVFLSVVNFCYSSAMEEAYEMLHIQTKQIKDDLTLQINSDMENLATMASFASKLYSEGSNYDLMFEAFKPIGLFSRIGILTPECKFITKESTIDLSESMSFEAEVLKGKHVTGRTYSYSRPGERVVRCSVPIVVRDKTVGIMYGIIKIETINERYSEDARDIDAQLFVYDKETGKFIIDTIDKNMGELSELKNRKYNEGYSYETLVNTDKGYTSFKSKFTGENLHVHYSTIEDFNWGIMLARYETQVFAETHKLFRNLLVSFLGLVAIMAIYLEIVLKRERYRTKLNTASSVIRKLLLEVTERYTNITEAMKKIKEFSRARSTFYVDTDGEYYSYIKPSLEEKRLTGKEREYFHKEIFRYVADIHKTKIADISFMQIFPNNHLEKTNKELYDFLIKHEIKDVSFGIITSKNNHIGVLGAINSNNVVATRDLIEDVAVCFSIAMYNKKHLNRTEIAATTDSLTGALNRVVYKKDILTFDEEKPEDFSCIYIDVNELHIRNNKYGHAAGDEMLIYIANTLKDVFFGHRIYRMGGDEFLVFTQGISQEEIKHSLEAFIENLKTVGYNKRTI